jgi:hypothetical protein
MRRIKITIIVTIIAIQGLWLSVCGKSREPSSTWERAIIGTRVLPLNGPQLEVTVLMEVSGELVGRCMLANAQSGSYEPVKLVIEGEWRHGFFWPTVESQVGDQYAGPWQTIRGRSFERKAAKLILERGEIMTELKVNLEPFRRYIGKYRVGRIVLSSNDSGVFELNDLIPSEKPPSETSPQRPSPKSASSPKAAITPGNN